jgi:hypothetical protein
MKKSLFSLFIILGLVSPVLIACDGEEAFEEEELEQEGFGEEGLGEEGLGEEEELGEE